MVDQITTKQTRGDTHPDAASLCMKKGDTRVHAAALFVACLAVWLN